MSSIIFGDVYLIYGKLLVSKYQYSCGTSCMKYLELFVSRFQIIQK